MCAGTACGTNRAAGAGPSDERVTSSRDAGHCAAVIARRRIDLELAGFTMCLAVPGQLRTKTTVAGLSLGRVAFGGITRDVCLDFVPEVNVGDYVLVHVGFAIARVDAEEAARAYEILEQMGTLNEELANTAADRPAE